MMGKEPYLRGMWEHFLQERSRAKRFRELAVEEKQAGMQGQWQQESPAREHLEHVKCCHVPDCNEPMMKKGFTSLKNETWEESSETFRKRMRSLRMGLRQDQRGVRVGSTGRGRKRWALCKRSCSEARTICAHHCARWRTWRGHNVVLVLALQQFPSGRLRLVGSKGKTAMWWCAIFGEKYDWKQQNRLLVVQ